jgi:hypothetical protein
MTEAVPSELLNKAFLRDLRLFSTHPNHYRALLFPPLNSFSRLCLHNLVKDNFPDLTSFSVGADSERRTVVGYQVPNILRLMLLKLSLTLCLYFIVVQFKSLPVFEVGFNELFNLNFLTWLTFT